MYYLNYYNKYHKSVGGVRPESTLGLNIKLLQSKRIRH